MGNARGIIMLIAWWHKEHPRAVNLIEDDTLPWINANWIEKRPADKDEIDMAKKGIYHYYVHEPKKLTIRKDK